ncbi:MAG: 50S ribosomal protein L18 [Alphaproteobacteria bacterium]|nr:50S ribosomal protein L18 [Alphaproteobacteria bacterium]MCL2757989.1 50S ribosomal protein L18 [Alphaproteobacteria bacterium]
MSKHLTTEQRRLLSNRGELKRKNPSKVRLCVFRSNTHIEIQAINDAKGCTLCAASSKEKGFKGKGHNIAGAAAVGKNFADRAKTAKLDDVYFDRGGYRYHGRVKALAEAIRAGGLKF